MPMCLPKNQSGFLSSFSGTLAPVHVMLALHRSWKTSPQAPCWTFRRAPNGWALPLQVTVPFVLPLQVPRAAFSPFPIHCYFHPSFQCCSSTPSMYDTSLLKHSAEIEKNYDAFCSSESLWVLFPNKTYLVQPMMGSPAMQTKQLGGGLQFARKACEQGK